MKNNAEDQNNKKVFCSRPKTLITIHKKKKHQNNKKVEDLNNIKRPKGNIAYLRKQLKSINT